MLRLITIGLAAAAFFSSTFILNRAMVIEGGHWIWFGTLRYVFNCIIIAAWIYLRYGPKQIKSTLSVLRKHMSFWLIVGTIGGGLFYAPICFSAQYAPGWVVASTWQFTIIAGLIIFPCFGKTIPGRGLVFSLLIFLGIVVVNAQHATEIDSQTILLGSLPILLAAFAYPIGNQLVGEAKHQGSKRVPYIKDEVMAHAPARVLLISIGSLPFWLIATAALTPPAPTTTQYISTAVISLFSGVIGTSLFLWARHESTDEVKVAAVDATQSGEILFSLVGEVLFLGAALPTLGGYLGMFIIIIGLTLYSFFATSRRKAGKIGFS